MEVILKDAGIKVHSRLAHLFFSRHTPEAAPKRCNVIVVPLYDKADPKEQSLHRLINATKHHECTVAEVLTNRISKTLEGSEPRELAGSGWDTQLCMICTQ